MAVVEVSKGFDPLDADDLVGNWRNVGGVDQRIVARAAPVDALVKGVNHLLARGTVSIASFVWPMLNVVDRAQNAPIVRWRWDDTTPNFRRHSLRVYGWGASNAYNTWSYYLDSNNDLNTGDEVSIKAVPTITATYFDVNSINWASLRESAIGFDISASAGGMSDDALSTEGNPCPFAYRVDQVPRGQLSESFDRVAGAKVSAGALISQDDLESVIDAFKDFREGCLPSGQSYCAWDQNAGISPPFVDVIGKDSGIAITNGTWVNPLSLNSVTAPYQFDNTTRDANTPGFYVPADRRGVGVQNTIVCTVSFYGWTSGVNAFVNAQGPLDSANVQVSTRGWYDVNVTLNTTSTNGIAVTNDEANKIDVFGKADGIGGTLFIDNICWSLQYNASGA